MCINGIVSMFSHIVNTNKEQHITHNNVNNKEIFVYDNIQQKDVIAIKKKMKE